jgi:hypothetical protein
MFFVTSIVGFRGPRNVPFDNSQIDGNDCDSSVSYYHVPFDNEDLNFAIIWFWVMYRYSILLFFFFFFERWVSLKTSCRHSTAEGLAYVVLTGPALESSLEVKALFKYPMGGEPPTNPPEGTTINRGKPCPLRLDLSKPKPGPHRGTSLYLKDDRSGVWTWDLSVNKPSPNHWTNSSLISILLVSF